VSKPVFDASHPAIKRLIALGKLRGYVTYAQANAAFPKGSLTQEDTEAVIATLNNAGIELVESHDASDSMPLFALMGTPKPKGEPSLIDRAYGANAAEAQRYLADVDSRQSMYLTASGTLTQFNAILAAILGAALSAVAAEPLRIVIAVALLLHVWAAFALCWAARPIASNDMSSTAMTLVARYHVTDHTFRTYRFGWRVTLAALVVSAIAAVLYVGQTFRLVARLGL
jgi:hypothetical protein